MEGTRRHIALGMGEVHDQLALVELEVEVVMRTSIPLLHPQPLLLYILDQLLELAHAN